jgi:uncharacterized damage-inducible protein DinB
MSATHQGTADVRPFVAPTVLQLKLNAGLMKSTLDGLGERDLWTRQTDHNNPILWIFGHVVATRASLLHTLGEAFDTGWGKKFARGAPLLDKSEYPPIQEIQRVHHDVTERLKARFAALTDAELAGPPTAPELPGVKTLADQLAFFAFHESYHVGQMAYVRKGLGHSPVAG